MKKEFTWVPDKSGIGAGASLRLNGISVAEVSASGGWGYCEEYLKQVRPSRLAAYHRTVEKAMAAVEKRFNLRRVKLKD